MRWISHCLKPWQRLRPPADGNILLWRAIEPEHPKDISPVFPTLMGYCFSHGLETLDNISDKAFNSGEMTMRIVLLLLCLLAMPVTVSASFQAMVVNVLDGDTLTVLTPQGEQLRIRLYGVDTPEKRQLFGQDARHFTARKVSGRTVEIQEMDRDKYGRIVGIVYHIGKQSLNRELLENGLAWYYGDFCKQDFCKEWKRIEQTARKNRVGLWSNKKSMPPWDWRKKERMKRGGSND